MRRQYRSPAFLTADRHANEIFGSIGRVKRIAAALIVTAITIALPLPAPAHADDSAAERSAREIADAQAAADAAAEADLDAEEELVSLVEQGEALQANLVALESEVSGLREVLSQVPTDR